MNHNSTEDTGETNESAVQSVIPENNEEIDTTHGDQRLWVKPPDELFTEQIKEEIEEVHDEEFESLLDVKDEVVESEEVEDDEVTAEPITISEPIEPPIEVQLPKVAIPKIKAPNTNRNAKKPIRRMVRRPRPILPMTRPIASTSTSLMEPTSTQHQIIMPSPQMPGIAYQIFLGDHSKNANNSVQYAMLQSQPVFLQQTPTSVSTPSSVVISQPSIVMNQHYQMRERKNPPPLVPKLAPKIVNQNYCPFCYKLFNKMNEHITDCWLNPDSKNYKFRKIAPSTPL